MVALNYNWWSLFTRRVHPDKHHEAITSRPLMLQAVARQTSHSGQAIVTITRSHAKAHLVQAAMQELAAFLKHIAQTAEQLRLMERIEFIAMRAFMKLLTSATPLSVCKCLQAPGRNWPTAVFRIMALKARWCTSLLKSLHSLLFECLHNWEGGGSCPWSFGKGTTPGSF